MPEIRLAKQEWSYDPGKPLGPEGGFGIVYAGEGRNIGPVAVKRLKLSANAAAHRELRIATELAEKQHAHVIPVYDAGEDAETGDYFVVMAKADRSLLDEISARGPITSADAAGVLLQISRGLAEVSHLVHRDLKPGNVLLHGGIWKVADFGIARFVEESTSLQTLKGCLSAPYAAPEQWRLERATNATDVYALACMFENCCAVRSLGVLPVPNPYALQQRRTSLLTALPFSTVRLNLSSRRMMSFM